MKGLLEADELARYADAIVKVGISVGRDDDLLVSCQPAHREFAVALVEAGYRAGARSVDVEYVDPLVRAAYLRTAPDRALGHVAPWRGSRIRASTRPETASLFVAGEGEPGALDGIPGKRLADDMTRSVKRFADVRRASRLGKRRWSIAAWPTESWAASVYPKLGAVPGRGSSPATCSSSAASAPTTHRASPACASTSTTCAVARSGSRA